MKNQKLFFAPPTFEKFGGKKFQKSGAVSKKNSQHTQLLCLVRWIAMVIFYTIYTKKASFYDNKSKLF
jgi:hypothetical protein